MAEENAGRQPSVLILSFEKSILDMLREVLQLEGYRVIVTHRANDTLGIVEREGGKYVVLMDNFHASGEAQCLLKTLPVRPELRTRMRIVGMAAFRYEELADLDAYIKMPPKVDDLVNPIARLCAELKAGE